MAIVFVWIDRAKNVFASHGVDDHVKATLFLPAVRRNQLMEMAALLPLGSIAVLGVHRHTPPGPTCSC